jgi:hypothetical protein
MEQQQPKLVMRPVTSPSAIEHARRMTALGLGSVEEHADGRVWAEGPDRRARPREQQDRQSS